MAPPVSVTACLAEFVAMTLFVVIGCGSAMGMAHGEGWLLQVSLTFGLAITSLAYAVGHFSGGHINCAVTLGLVLTKHCTVQQGVANFFAQMAGSLAGAVLLCLVYPSGSDRTGSLGSNGVSERFHWQNAMLGEIMMTFLLVFVVLHTACHPQSAANRPQACIAIGFAVFLAHTVLIPIDGCSINPTRSFGPAMVAQARYQGSKSLDGFWIFWVGPLLGAALAAGLYEGLKQVFPEAFKPIAGGVAEKASEGKPASKAGKAGKASKASAEDRGHGVGSLGLDDICIGMADVPEEAEEAERPAEEEEEEENAEEETKASPRGSRRGSRDSSMACCMFFKAVTGS